MSTNPFDSLLDFIMCAISSNDPKANFIGIAIAVAMNHALSPFKIKKVKVKEAAEQDWSDEGAPFASQKFSSHQILWFPFLVIVTNESIQTLDNKNITASIFWITYESYILFDHIPFLFTNNVYKSPRFNFTYLSPVFFWGLESIASIVSTQSLVNAPIILLYNVVPHCFFIGANNFYGAAASKAFVAEQKKTWWVSLQVIVDIFIHSTSLWYHLKYIVSSHVSIQIEVGVASPWLYWSALMASMLFLTYMVHNDEMHWSYFFAPFLTSMIETKKMN